ncbi:hypothetical protein K505DRAFT_373824 [Melanomma pulvis-pyrius CBS 109.77]|uniref:AB hydrolase-1 domain-containing protein n=1 Tax=Melanomma pulvis-pyrius CBS 109.77 TaxID=1314802 RepID=A0A6A6XGC3_9PLEO|nr:hypothetical protein K505DRAFT_373824 [Melanomma pulvis-pyrius CBS 109.77]
MGALEFLCDRRFHQSYLLPPNPETGRSKPHRFSYADFGDSSSNAIVLFCGALVGTRLCYSLLDQLAKAYSVRIIHPDRPGIGGSDPIELEKRIQIWLEMVPQLLNHLNIAHVSLASHSGGDIYLLNTMLAYPQLLHPSSPYICFFAPWVHHSHSEVLQMRATELLPAPMIGKFASVAKFVNKNVIPLVGLSGSLLEGMKAPWFHSNAPPETVSPTLSNMRSRTPSISSHEATHSLALDNPRVVEELRRHVMTFVFAESVDGISEDAQLFLKRPRSIPWCSPSIAWTDIDGVPVLLSKIIDEEAALQSKSRRWSFDAFHAEHDHMVGEKGRHWFDRCWTPSAPTNSPQSEAQLAQKGYEYRSQTVKGTDHDFLMDPAFGASEVWLQRVRQACPLPVEV